MKFVCTRCAGSGIYHNHGVCFSCNGRGYHVYASASVASRYANNTGQTWSDDLHGRNYRQREAIKRDKELKLKDTLLKKGMIRDALKMFWSEGFYWDMLNGSEGKIVKGHFMVCPSFLDRTVWRVTIAEFPFHEYRDTKTPTIAAGDLCLMVLLRSNGLSYSLKEWRNL